MTYKKIITADGSITLHSDLFQEACHSLSGARAETIYNYIEGCEISRQNCQSILEIGFGTGLGLICSDDFFVKNPPASKRFFVSTEIDEQLISLSQEIYPDELKFFPTLRSLTRGPYYYQGSNANSELIILIGDARETMQKFYRDFVQYPKFDAIYHDAFSPKKNPLLWSNQWFDLLVQGSSPEVIFSTYSSSNSVRKALEKSGFQIQDRRGLPPKNSVTRAFLKSDKSFEKKFQRDTIPDLSDPSFPKLF
jgi:tRNA U34 5-methylaminomethyl-2-thiouridine-forming methyltransferase MnmC